MRRSSALTVSALALTLAFVLGGCSSSSSDGSGSGSESGSGSDESSQSVEIDATAAAGDIVAGDGYSYTIPVGWGEQDAAIAPGTDTVALDLAATGDFATNVNVVLSPAGAVTADQVEAAMADELEGSGATDVENLDRVTVADSESAHITAIMTASGATYRIHQYYVTNDDQTYVVTFSADPAVPDADVIGIAESVLVSWTWS